jgi:hypothetical protein
MSAAVRGVGASLNCSMFVLNVIKRASENSVRAKFAFWAFCEVRFPFVTNVSIYAI